jgi:hypothetical protein
LVQVWRIDVYGNTGRGRDGHGPSFRRNSIRHFGRNPVFNYNLLAPPIWASFNRGGTIF